jgi:uncharacterized protein (TIGR03435 family)
LLRVSGEKSQTIYADEPLAFGEIIRSNIGAGAVVALADGSRIEMRPNSELALEHADDGVRILLNGGSVIVTAAKQKTGHLYVQTKDVSVSVAGTVFLVNAEDAGSRVAVIQGEVRVIQGGTSKKLLPGEQVATNWLMESHPMSEEISWSRNAEAHLALLQQSVKPAGTTPASAIAPSHQEFEVASLKPSGVFWPPDFIECRGVDGVWSLRADLSLNPIARPTVASAASTTPLGRCVGLAFLRAYISAAYDIRMDRISGDEIAHYQLEARAADPSTATTEQLREMLRKMVIDRFKPKIYRETKETAGYVLLVGKGGIKFKETSGDEEDRRSTQDPDQPVGIKGKYRLKRFASNLSTLAGLPVIDKTDLPVIYDLNLTLNRVRSVGGGPRGASGGNVPEYDPPLSKALEEQLGLRLESVKVPIDYLVVDHVEKPSGN